MLALALVVLAVVAGLFLPLPGTSPAPSGTPTPVATPQPRPAPQTSSEPSAPSTASGEDREDKDSEVISEIIADPNLDHASVVVRLLEVLPTLSPDAQAEAAQHISNLSEDDTAAKWTGLFINNQLPVPAQEVFFGDLLNRDHELSMPVLAKVADQPLHPMNKDVKEILEVLFETPPAGQTWDVWVRSQMQEESQSSP